MSKPLYCPDCGVKNDEEATHCTECGSLLKLKMESRVSLYTRRTSGEATKDGMIKDQNSELFLPLEPLRERAPFVPLDERAPVNKTVDEYNLLLRAYYSLSNSLNNLDSRWEKFLQDHKTFRGLWWMFEACPVMFITLFITLICLLLIWVIAR